MPAQKPAQADDEGFDATALLDEIKSTARPFTLHGERFLLPAPTVWPDAAMAAANSGDTVGCARLILGDAEYDRFERVGGTALFLQELVAKLHGASVGESSASSSS